MARKRYAIFVFLPIFPEMHFLVTAAYSAGVTFA